MMGRFRLIGFSLIWGWHSIGWGQVDTLPMMWKQGCEYLTRGDATKAANRFSELETWYQEEPKFIDLEFQRRYQPIAAIAYLIGGQQDQGIRMGEKYLSTFPETTEYRALIQYLTADAWIQSHHFEAANQLYDQFLEENTGLNESSIILWKKIEIALREEQFETAKIIAQKLQKNDNYPNGIRLAAAILIEQLNLINPPEDYKPKTKDLLNQLPSEHIASMWLAGLIPQISKELIQRQRYDEANELTPWMLTRDELKSIAEFHAERMISQEGNTLTNDTLRQRIWHNHYSRIKSQFNTSFKTLCDSYPDNSELNLSHLRLLYDQKKHHESIALAQVMTLSEMNLDAEIQSELFRYRIKNATSLEWWTEVLRSLDVYEKRFPNESKFLNKVRFETYRALWKSGEHVQSRIKLENMIQDYPDASTKGLWIFTLATWQAEIQEHNASIENFRLSTHFLAPFWIPFAEFEMAKIIAEQKGPDKANAACAKILQSESLPHSLRRNIILFQLKCLSAMEQWKMVEEKAHHLIADKLEDGIEIFAHLFLSNAFEHFGDLNEAMNQFDRALTKASPQIYPTIHDKYIEFIQEKKSSSEVIVAIFNYFENYQTESTFWKNHPHYLNILSHRVTKNEDKKLFTESTQFVGKYLSHPSYPYAFEWFDFISVWNHHCQNIHANEYKILIPDTLSDSAEWDYHSFQAEQLNRDDKIDRADAKWIALSAGEIPPYASATALIRVARTLSKYDLADQEKWWDAVRTKTENSDFLAESSYQIAKIHLDHRSEDGLSYMRTVVKEYVDSKWADRARIELTRILLYQDPEEAKCYLDTLLESPELAPKERAQSLNMLGKYHLKNKEFSAAALIYEQIISLYLGIPDEVETAYLNLLDCYSELKEMPSSERIREKAIAWTSAHPERNEFANKIKEQTPSESR